MNIFGAKSLIIKKNNKLTFYSIYVSGIFFYI